VKNSASRPLSRTFFLPLRFCPVSSGAGTTVFWTPWTRRGPPHGGRCPRLGFPGFRSLCCWAFCLPQAAGRMLPLSWDGSTCKKSFFPFCPFLFSRVNRVGRVALPLARSPLRTRLKSAFTPHVKQIRPDRCTLLFLGELGLLILSLYLRESCSCSFPRR